MSEKATLQEMAEAIDDEAIGTFASVKASEQFNPGWPPNKTLYRKVFVLERAAELLRILGTYEDDSRKFVAGLLARHASGK